VQTNKALNNIGLIYDSQLNMPDSALYYYQRSLEISTNSQENYDILNTRLNIGYLEAKLGNYNKGRDEILQVLQQTKAIGAQEMVKYCYLSLSEIDEDEDEYKSALNNFQQYSAIKDSVYNEQFQNKISDLQVKYETEKEACEKEAYKLALFKQRTNNLLLIFGTVILVIFLVISLYSFKQKTIHNKKLTAEIEIRKQIENGLEERVIRRTKLLTTTNQHLKEEIENHEIAKSRLEAIKETLEEQVKLRTNQYEKLNLELNEKNRQLELINTELSEMNKVFVGREFRIKELRDEVAKLKQSGSSD